MKGLLKKTIPVLIVLAAIAGCSLLGGGMSRSARIAAFERDLNNSDIDINKHFFDYPSQPAVAITIFIGSILDPSYNMDYIIDGSESQTVTPGEWNVPVRVDRALATELYGYILMREQSVGDGNWLIYQIVISSPVADSFPF